MNNLKVGDIYYRVIRKQPSVEYKAKFDYWRQDQLVICKYTVTKVTKHKCIGNGSTGKNEVNLIPITPIKVASTTICQDCIDYDTSDLTGAEIYNNINEFIFTDKSKAEDLYKQITAYKQSELNEFNSNNNANCAYPFKGVQYEV